MPFNNYAPQYVFKGQVQADSAPSANNDLVRKQDVAGLSYISSIAAGSSNYLSVDGSGALSVSNLLVTDVVVNTTDSSLANYISNSASSDNLGVGDIVILTAPADNLMYIVKAGTGSQASDYEEIQSSLTAAEIVALLTGGTGISISGTGTIAIDFNEFDTDSLSEGSNNLFYSSSLFNNDFAGKSTGDLQEGSNLYYTDARSRTALSAGGDLSYNNSTGLFSVTTYKSSDFNNDFNAKSTDNLSEGSSNLYYTDARSRASVSASGDLTYTQATGVFNVVTYKSSDFNNDFAGKDTDDLAEGSLSLYYTDARSRSALSGGSGISYTSGSGQIAVDDSHFRSLHSGQNFTANTAKTINHALNQKYVQVSVYDSSDNLIHAEVSLTDANNLTVTTSDALTGCTVIVSI